MPMTIKMRSGRTINHKFYGHGDSWTAKTDEEINLARILVSSHAANEVEEGEPETKKKK